MLHAITLVFSLLAVARGQQVGTQVTENHPRITTQRCTASGCTTQQSQIVLDSNWRWLHTTSGYTNCYTGNEWDTSLCPDGATCARNCALDGAEYSSTYGITTSGNALTLKFVTGANVGSRVYLMSSDTQYQMFRLLNQEFTFDVDMSKLPCGLNGAVYFVEMAQDGGMSKYSSNRAGAKYGTGYCDSQCPHDIKFINGEGNVVGWAPSPNDTNAGSGQYGTCCAEMDIWEANSQAAAYTPHPCLVTGQTRCSGIDCGDASDRYNGVCDKDGCDYNSWRVGDRTFLGEGKTVDTRQKITVVTQFITDTGTASGTLKEIRRLYVQGGRVIQNSVANMDGLPSQNFLDQPFCDATKVVFNDNDSFTSKGAMRGMGEAMGRGMVLALSVWDDHTAHMLWLDSEYPLDRDPAAPGISRGPCSRESGKPTDVERDSPGATVIYSNIKWGDLNSTFNGTAGPSPTTIRTTSVRTTATRTSTGSGSNPTLVPRWGQCGGNGWTGPTQCVSGSTCTRVNDWFWQCL